jgi:antitoxin component YwqK of YwqJK toxin-antitoxin module
MKSFYLMLAILLVLTANGFAQSNPAREAAAKRGTQSPADGVWYVYDRNGALQKEEHYRSYRLEGDVKVFYSTGAIKSITQYIDGQRQGAEKVYYEAGGLKSENTYSQNNLNGPSRQYYENGALKKEATYLDGQLHDVAKDYFEDGKLKQIWNYSKGVITGSQIKYNEDGQVTEEDIYVNGVMVSHKDYTKPDASLVSKKPEQPVKTEEEKAAEPAAVKETPAKTPPTPIGPDGKALPPAVESPAAGSSETTGK